MPTPPQIVNQVMDAVNPRWNSNTTIHIGVIAIPTNVHTINAMPFVPFCLAYEAGRNDSSTKLRSIGQHFGNGLHHFVRVVAHLPHLPGAATSSQLPPAPASLQRVVNALLIFPTEIV